MAEFIIKYWLETAFGAVCFIFLFFGKRIMGKIKKIQEAESKEFEENLISKITEQINKKVIKEEEDFKNHLDKIMNEIQEIKDIMFFQDEEIQEHLKQTNLSLKAVKEATLASYKKEFYSFCENILAKGYITLEEHKELINLYKIYKKLGGNGNGETLFQKIMQLEIR